MPTYHPDDTQDYPAETGKPADRAAWQQPPMARTMSDEEKALRRSKMEAREVPTPDFLRTTPDESDRGAAEDDLSQCWLCVAGHFHEDGMHCPSTGQEPPWGCPCGHCQDGEDNEPDEDDPLTWLPPYGDERL